MIENNIEDNIVVVVGGDEGVEYKNNYWNQMKHHLNKRMIGDKDSRIVIDHWIFLVYPLF
jgi:hypothetical protein